MTLKQLQAIVDACLREPAGRDGYPCERKSEPEVRRALKDYAKANPYPSEAFYRLAFDFHSETGTVADQCGILDRWKRAKGSPFEPICLYCQLAEEGSVSKQALKENLEEGLKREPDDLRLLAVAYDFAKEQDNRGRRLFLALQLSKLSKTVANFVIYGIECGRNAMPERAEEAFNEALKLDPKSVSALNVTNAAFV